MKKLSRIPRAVLGLGLIVSVTSATGCDPVVEDRADNARLVITGGGEAVLTLETSTNFVVATEESSGARVVFLFSADTLEITPPYDQTYPLPAPPLFFMRVSRTPALDESVIVSVFLDKKEKYNYTSLLGEEILEFTYR